MLSNGILDIEDTEGEEISLTAEAPQLTEEEKLRIESEDEEDGEKRIDLFASEDGEADPLNKLLMAEDGISTLFMKKGGKATKNIKGQPHMLAYITPGEAKTLENLGGQKTMTKEGIPAYPPSDNYGGDWGGSSNDFSGMDSGGWDPGVSSPGTTSSGGNVNTGGDQEDDVAQMMSDMNITPDNTPNYTGSDYGFVISEDEQTEKGGSDYIGPIDRVRINQDIVDRKKKYDSFSQSALRGIKTIGSFMSITNPFSFAKFVYDQKKKQNQRIAEIDADLALLDKIEATKFTPHTDTIYQMLEQEKLDLTQPKSQKDDGTGDGPETIVEELMAAQETIEDRDETDIFDLWDRIKSNQAKRAMLVEKDIIQDNKPEETMMLNSGGLANLFRVKTQ